MAERDPRAIQSSASMKNFTCGTSAKPDKYSLHLANLSKRIHLKCLAATETKEKIRTRLRRYLSMSECPEALVLLLRYILKHLDRVLRMPRFYGVMQAVAAGGSGGGMDCSGDDQGRAPPILLSLFSITPVSSTLTDATLYSCPLKMGLTEDTEKIHQEMKEKKPGLWMKAKAIALAISMSVGIGVGAANANEIVYIQQQDGTKKAMYSEGNMIRDPKTNKLSENVDSRMMTNQGNPLVQEERQRYAPEQDDNYSNPKKNYDNMNTHFLLIKQMNK